MHSNEVMTVTGPVPADQLGIVLPHEHLFIDLRNQFREPASEVQRRLALEPVCMRFLGLLRNNPYALLDNLVLDDVPTAVQEAEAFKEVGGRTIVDCTSIGIGRDAMKLREVALRTSLNIVAGSGHYTYDTHPAGMDDSSSEEIADAMLRDLLVGIDGTDIRAGIYGEIGTSSPIQSNECKCLRATALAFRRHPAEVQVHTFPWGRAGVEAAQLLINGGVDPARIVICHIDVAFELSYLLELLTLGVFVEFDNFGKEFYIRPADRGFAGGVFARDIERVRMIQELLQRGYERQILITTDVCLKSLLRTYGGFGYDHIPRNIIPMMCDQGIQSATIDRFTCENPSRALVGGI